MSKIDWVIFDLGAVLIDWNPRYVYRRVELASRGSQKPTETENEVRIEDFLRDVATGTWNSQMDAGTLFQAAIDARVREFPEWRDWLQMWRDEWPTMMRGLMPDMVPLFEEVVAVRRAGGLRGVLALSNWEANTFKIAKVRFPFLASFDERLISGEEKLIKPNPEFFKLLQSRFGVDPKRAIFIDDLTKNTEVASSLGFQVHVFEDAARLRADLESRNILKTRTST